MRNSEARLFRWLLPLSAVLFAACASNETREAPEQGPGPVVPSPTLAVVAPPVGKAVASSPSDESVPPLVKDPILFARASAVVDDAAMRVLRRHAERLKEDSALIVTLVGRTDDLGSRSYNLAIAERRISAVTRVLRDLDVPRRQLRRASAGGEVIGRSCATEDCRALRRRVDLIYSKEKRTPVLRLKQR